MITPHACVRRDLRDYLCQADDKSKMSNLQKRLSTLSPEKLALILKKLQKNKQDRPAGKLRSARDRVREVPIGPIAREGAIPLSFAQQRLWFLDQIEGGGASYNMPGVLRLDGRLNLMAFRKSLNEMVRIVRRHEVLKKKRGVKF